MKKLWNSKFVTLLVLLGCNIILLSDRIFSQQQKIDLKFVKEIELAKGVRKVFFDFGNPLNPKPKVEVFEKRIVFYGNVGNQTFQKLYENYYVNPIEVWSSRNKKFFVVRELLYRPEKGEHGKLNFEFYNEQGVLLWTAQRNYHYDVAHSHFLLSNIGTAVELRPDGMIWLYNAKGNLIKKIRVVEEPDWETLGLMAEFSADGKYIAVSTAPPVGSKRNAYLLMFDSQGQKQWEFKSERERIVNVFFSPDNEFILASDFDVPSINTSPRTFILRVKNGGIATSLENLLIYKAKFFQVNSEHFVLTVSNGLKDLYLINLTRQQFKKIVTVKPAGRILSADVVENENENVFLMMIASSNYKRPYLHDPYVQFFNLSGYALTKLNFPVNKLRYSRLSYSIYKDKTLIIKTNKRLLLFYIEAE